MRNSYLNSRLKSQSVAYTPFLSHSSTSSLSWCNPECTRTSLRSHQHCPRSLVFCTFSAPPTRPSDTAPESTVCSSVSETTPFRHFCHTRRRPPRHNYCRRRVSRSCRRRCTKCRPTKGASRNRTSRCGPCDKDPASLSCSTGRAVRNRDGRVRTAA
jgi:hypothetical protein